MKFSDFIVYSAIQSDLTATSKEEAIREMFSAMSNAGVIPEMALENCISLAIKRESLGTSGIGGGCAIPTTAWPEMPHSVASIFFSQRGLDFESLDGEPVHLLFAIVKQPKNLEFHVRMMEYISRAMLLEAKWSRLQTCQSRVDIIDWLDAIDTVLGG